MVCVALFWLVRALTSRPLRERDLLLRLFTFGGALAVGTALAAITLIPFAELLSHSIDIDARTAAASDAHEPARYLLGIFLHDWWGRGSRVPLEFASALEEHAYYVAALPLMLAASALVLAPAPRADRRGRGGRRRAGGGHRASRPSSTSSKSLPGFDAARNGRLAVVSVLCVAVLAGWGLDDLTGPEAARGAAGGGSCWPCAAAWRVLPVVMVGAPARCAARSAEPGAARGLGLRRPPAAPGRRQCAIVGWPRCSSGCCRRRWLVLLVG